MPRPAEPEIMFQTFSFQVQQRGDGSTIFKKITGFVKAKVSAQIYSTCNTSAVKTI